MVIIRLKGGLGNQLFQYAMAKSLAIKKKTILKIDRFSGFQNDNYGRKYCLDKFNIACNFASKEEILRIKKFRQNIAFRALNKFLPYHKRFMIEEHPQWQFKYDRNLEKVNQDVYLDGYWQNEKYFIEISDLLRKELTLKETLDPINLDLAKRIRATNSVSIHLRLLYSFSADGSRFFPDAKDLYADCPPDYYQSALDLISKTVENPSLFVFSDNPQWAKDNLQFSYNTTFVTNNNAENGYKDLMLTSICKHNIIANSSFSWWGAWLNTSPDKIVIAPRKYFNSPSKFDTSDLFPQSWRIL